MKCELCQIASEDCDAAYEMKDGTYGCKIPANRIAKIEKEYDEYIGRMGTDMGVELNFEYKKLPIDHAVELCKHMIGLDYKNPYTRHGKKFYTPYRNFFAATPKGEPCLDALGQLLVNRSQETADKCVLYTLTREGLNWLGRQINVTIYNVDR